MSRAERVSVGIAGLGRSGWNIHAALLQGLSEKYAVTAVFDTLAERREEAEQRFGCTGYADFEAMLADDGVELVIVALPSHLHAEYSVRALQAGKMVVCEKPMARNLQEADRMIQTAGETGTLLTIFQNRRYAPDFLTVRRVIDSGVLGRIAMIRIAYHGYSRRWDWQTLTEFGGGTLSNTCPHPVDQALLLFGEQKPKVFCLLDRVLSLGNADDHVKIVLHGSGCPTIEIEVTSACAYPQDTWLVMGSAGGLAGTSEHLRWKYCDALPLRDLDTRPTSDRSYNREAIEWHEESWTSEAVGVSFAAGFYRDLYEAIRNNVPLPVTPESVRRQIEVFDQCRRSE